MQYIGIITQQQRNNRLSILLLLLFPLIILGIVLLFFVILGFFEGPQYNIYGYPESTLDWNNIFDYFLNAIPWVIVFVGIWFVISYFSNASIIRHATGARPLERKENPRIYNMIENLCMNCGMNTPKINIIDDPELNAFASGIDEKSYTVTLTTGIIEKLNDEELEGVIGHELTHIRNKDTRLLIVSIIFVGILATLASILWHVLYFAPVRRSNGKNGAFVMGAMVVALICCGVGYFFTMLTRFAISRKREFMADAGGAELTSNPLALASALRKISAEPGLTNIKRDDVAQLFIYHKLSDGNIFNHLFSTHPDIKERIRILEQF